MVIVTAALAVAAGYTSLLVSQREQALVRTAHYHSVFQTSQAATELMRLESQIGRYALKPSDTLKEDVQTRLSVLQNRLRLMSEGDTDTLIVANHEADAARSQIVAGLEATRPWVDDLDRIGAPQTVLDILSSLDLAAATLVSRIVESADGSADRERRELARVHWEGLALTFGLIACGFVLVVMLMQRTRASHALAYLDPLTGLPNRLDFQAKLDGLVSGARSGGDLAILLLDVDGFKQVNDAFGHATGDKLLRALAQRLEKRIAGVQMSRLGGDEFAILLSGDAVRQQAIELAQSIGRVTAESFEIGGKRVPASMSIGIMVGAAGFDPDTMYQNADAALYAAKAAGRGTYRIFDPQMEKEIRARREMEADLRIAIVNDELELYFQPIVDLSTLRVIGCEALTRWPHPRHGMISPSTFIPLAEACGLIVPLGSWVIRQACAVARTWPEAIRVSINLSSEQFERDDLVEVIRDALRQTGLSADRVELEITESVFLQNHDHVLQTLSRLKQMGARIALDDFGTGYSSIGYLQRFPIDKIKIDQSFVREITSKQDSALIVEAIAALGLKLGVTTTAEGIETQAHAALVTAMGCTEGQGYHFAKPMTAEACLEALVRQKMGVRPGLGAAA